MNFAGCTRKRIRSIAALFGTVALSIAHAHGQQNVTTDVNGKVLDLVFHVEDMGGKTQSLEVKQIGNEVRIDLAADVLFDFDKATLLPKAQQTLEQAADIIRDKAKGPVRIEGYTDAKGLAAYNQKLSERRAAAVKNWLVSRGGLSKVAFVTKGFGAQNPVAPNKKPDGSDDPDGRAKNRRVEIILQTQAS
jgi:outer membrane protein OmpA-like peptidoglycan-associated protein